MGMGELWSLCFLFTAREEYSQACDEMFFGPYKLYNCSKKKRHPLWLWSHCESTFHLTSMTLFNAKWDQSCSTHSPRWQSDCECRRSLQTGLSSSRQEAWSSLDAAMYRLPAALADLSQQPLLMVCATLRWTAVLITACVTYPTRVMLCLCLATHQAQPGQMDLSSPRSCLHGSCLQTGRPCACHAKGQEAF